MEVEKTSVKRWITALQSVDPKSRNAGLASRVLKLASKPRRSRIEVSLDKIERNANSSESVVIPGKVLGTGSIKKKVNIAAIEFSGSAEEKLARAGCKLMDIEEILKSKDVRILV